VKRIVLGTFAFEKTLSILNMVSTSSYYFIS
jgi:hypothetical protein